MRWIVLLFSVFMLCLLQSNGKTFDENHKEMDSETDYLNLTFHEKGLYNQSLPIAPQQSERGEFIRPNTTDLLNTTTSSLSKDLSEMGNITFGDATVRSLPLPNETKLEAGLISQKVYLKLEFITNYVSIPLCISCVVFNILNCVVFLDKHMRNITNDYLACISIIQLLHAMFILCGEILKRCLRGGTNSVLYQKQKLYIESFVLVVFRRVVYWLVMLVACERMVAFISPLKRKFKFSRSPIKYTTIITTLTFIFHIFSPLKFEVLDSTRNDTISLIVIKTSFDQNVIEIFSLLSQIIFVYVPLNGILLFNIVLCFALYRHAKAVGHLRCNGVMIQSSRDRQTTFAILISTIIFFFLALPLVTNAFLMNVLPNYNVFSENVYTFMFMHQFGFLLNMISFSTDFITYAIICSRYRNTLLRKFNTGCISKQSHRCVNTTNSLNQSNTLTETSYI